MNYFEQLTKLIGEPSTHALGVALLWLAWRVERLNAKLGSHGFRLKRLEKWTSVPADFDIQPEPTRQ